jgi:hypothetical protein
MGLDPLKRARVLARFDRIPQAIAVLRSAAAAEPAREDLRAELQALERQHRHLGLAGSAKHQLVGWVLFLGSLAAAFSLPVLLLHLVPSDLDPFGPSGLSFFAFLVLPLLAALVLGWLALKLFLRLWFAYLSPLPSNERFLAESALSRSMAIHLLEPQYTNARERYLPGTDA